MASQNKHKSSDYTLNTCPDMREDKASKQH